jgi:succinate-acetate transporter protein
MGTDRERVEGGIGSLFLRIVVRFLGAALFGAFVSGGIFWLVLGSPVPWDFEETIHGLGGEQNAVLILGAIPLLWGLFGIFCFETLLDLARRFCERLLGHEDYW